MPLSPYFCRSSIEEIDVQDRKRPLSQRCNTVNVCANVQIRLAAGIAVEADEKMSDFTVTNLIEHMSIICRKRMAEYEQSGSVFRFGLADARKTLEVMM